MIDSSKHRDPMETYKPLVDMAEVDYASRVQHDMRNDLRTIKKVALFFWITILSLIGGALVFVGTVVLVADAVNDAGFNTGVEGYQECMADPYTTLDECQALLGD